MGCDRVEVETVWCIGGTQEMGGGGPRLPTVRYLDAEKDIYGFEMLRRLLLEIRQSSPLLQSLRDAARSSDFAARVFLGLG